MSTEVLAGLIYSICEVYLDDIIVFGTTEEEFLINLEQVFQRLEEKNITLNPKKCKFGLELIQYVGHTINQEGISFTRDKLDRVIDFPKPVRQQELKQFLGLVNYFRSHIRDHSSISAPMNMLVHDYHRTHKVIWNPEATAAFEEMRKRIDNCPTLFFLDPKAPIFLHTDASIYGLGAYLFQLVIIDGKPVERPVEFISKSFSQIQLRWSVPEKEAYAIFYSVRKLDYLLRDVFFTLRTDHKNLVYLNEKDASAKIKRWKLLIQEYNFDIEHIPGTLNVIADALSRLCDNVTPVVNPLDTLLEEEFHDMWMYLEEEQEIWALDEEPVLTPEISKEIDQVHNAMCGHGGVKRTVSKLLDKKVKFAHMREIVNIYIKACPFCQKQNYRKTDNITLPFTTAQTMVMQRLNIDTIGPLIEDEEGFLYLIVVIDCFSRWVMCYPVRTVGAEDCAWALIQHFGIFGVAKEILSDNGTQFCNKIIDELIKIVGTKHITTTAYSKEENAIVERSNKEVVRHLRAILFDKNVITRWRRYVPFAQRICNAEVVSSTGVAPASIIFGGAINLDRDILSPNTMPEEHEHGDLSNYVADLILTQRAVIEIAKANQTAKDDAHMTTSDEVEETVYEPKSYVLLD
jgi:transposase InsO family protein